MYGMFQGSWRVIGGVKSVIQTPFPEREIMGTAEKTEVTIR